VAGTWAASIIADFLVKTYDPSPFVHFAMMGVLGAIFGRQFFNGNGNGGSK